MEYELDGGLRAVRMTGRGGDVVRGAQRHQHQTGLRRQLQAEVDGVVAHLQQRQDHDEQQRGGGEQQPRVLWVC